MGKRCDGLFDCLDKSDEYQCNKVLINKEMYVKEIPPFRHGTSVKIHVSIYLLSISKIELPSTFNAKIKLVLNWQDYRLTFTNLQKSGNIINEETRKKLWTPPIRFSNTQNGILLNDEEARMNVLREGNYALNDIKDLHEARLFKGEENTLRYSREYKMDFECDFNLELYPFDTQTCTVALDIPDFFNDYMDLIPLETGNFGTAELEQFWVTNVSLQSFGNNTDVKCMIHLKRIPWYHVATTYAPILCIFIMVLVTLFIDQSHFEATVMVSVTSMLVMYTLFQSITLSMPSTAYMKLMDYWLFFGLILPFIVFIILVSTELLGLQDNSRIDPTSMYPRDSKNSLWWCKCFLPLLTLLFVVSYLTVVILVYIEFKF